VKTLAGPNRYAIWDLILETDRAFDLDIMDRIRASIQSEVHNLDWDCYHVNREEGAGFARVTVRPFVIVPPDAVTRQWLGRAVSRFAVIYSVTFRDDNIDDLLDRVGGLPGEGLLINVDEKTGPKRLRELFSKLASFDRRVIAFRNSALQTLMAMQIRKPHSMLIPFKTGMPARDWIMLRVAPDGRAVYRKLSRKAVMLDTIQLAKNSD